MKKILFTLVCAAMVCACDARHNAKANNSETVAAVANEEDDAIMAPDFTLTDIYNMPLTLSSFRGTYVVLDFWGSWCIWCIRGIPSMKEAYAKHKDKMEILGIDCRDTEEKWKAAVEEHALPWLQVRCDDDHLEQLAMMYNIEGFPTKAVIDPEGKLVKVIVGEDPAFYPFLDELLGK